MNDPKRLLEEVDSDLARELLAAGRWSPWPPGIRRQRVLTALGVGLAVGTTNKVSLAAVTTWYKVVAIGCVVCAGAGGVVAYRNATTSSATAGANVSGSGSRHAEHDSVAIVPTVDQELPSLHLEPQALALDADLREVAPKRVRATTNTRVAVSRNEATESRVHAELTVLDQARSELRDGKPGAAIATLATYSTRFPGGVLGLEAEVLRVEALAAAGKTQEAARRAQRVLERNPKSVVASRLRRFATAR